MSTFNLTASAADVARLDAGQPSIFARLADMWAEHNARVARAECDQKLTRYNDEELKEMGYTSVAVARIRNSHTEPAHYWF